MPSFPSRAAPRALSLVLRQALLLAALALAGAAHAAADSYNGGAVAGCSYDDGTSTYSCGALSNANDIAISSGYTVIVNNSASIGDNQSLTMDGNASLQVAGSLTLATSKLALSGGNLSVAGGLTLSMGAADVTVNISAATIAINGSSNAVIRGTLTAAGALAFQSSMRVTGLVTADDTTVDMKVDVVARLQTRKLYVDKQASLTGNVNASGDVVVDNHSTIDGDLTAHDVVLKNACAYISGNATVNAITLGAQGTVGKTITCTGPGASGNSCVTDNNHSHGNACHHGGGGGNISLDHILISHTGSALTCEPQAVTITACADAACSAYYSDPVDVTLTPGGQAFTISGGVNDNATVQQSTAGNATLSASTAEAANPSTCYNLVTGSSSCTMVFSDAGFSFTIPDHRAEQSQSFTLRALKAGSTGNVCVPLLANVTHNVQFTCSYNNPARGLVPVRVNGVPLAATTTSSCSAGGATVGLRFDDQGQVQASLQYADAGRMTLNARLIPPSGPYAGLVLTGASNFIAAPTSFGFTIKSSDGSKTNPAASDHTGGAFIGAGQPFLVTMTALNATGAVTGNFGNESSPESYTIKQTLVAPIPGANPGVGASLGAITNGTTAEATMSWDEVGIINFAATLANANGYLNSGLGVTGNVNIGRFIPDHFDTALNGTVPMPCPPAAANPAIGNPCPAAGTGDKFVYSKQAFDVTVKAYSAHDTATTNYAGLYAKPVTLAAYNGLGSAGTTLNPNADTSVTPPGLNSPTVAAARFVQGVATADPADPASLHAYPLAVGYTPPVSGQPLPPAPTPPTNIWLRASDADGATSLRVGVPSNEARVTVVNGRQLVGNSYGSEALPMPVVVQAQYWNGTGWLNNPAYGNATPVVLNAKIAQNGTQPAFVFSNCQKNLANSGTNTCAVTFTLANDKLTFTGGVGKFIVAAPGKSGSVDITLSNGGTQAIPFLPSTTGRATFGVYRAGPVVYLREVY